MYLQPVTSAAKERLWCWASIAGDGGWLKESYSDAEAGVEVECPEGSEVHSRKQEQHLQMSWGERVWCAHGTHKGSRVAGSGEWGWNGGRVGRAQQCRVFGPCHSTGFMQKVCVYLCVCAVASVVSDTLEPHGLEPTRLPCPWDSPEYRSGLPFPTPGDLPDPGIEPKSLVPPALVGRFFTTAPPPVEVGR